MCQNKLCAHSSKVKQEKLCAPILLCVKCEGLEIKGNHGRNVHKKRKVVITTTQSLINLKSNTMKNTVQK